MTCCGGRFRAWRDAVPLACCGEVCVTFPLALMMRMQRFQPSWGPTGPQAVLTHCAMRLRAHKSFRLQDWGNESEVGWPAVGLEVHSLMIWLWLIANMISWLCIGLHLIYYCPSLDCPPSTPPGRMNPCVIALVCACVICRCIHWM